jgi:hypothetical protein
LQIRVDRFDSGTRLQYLVVFASYFLKNYNI